MLHPGGVQIVAPFRWVARSPPYPPFQDGSTWWSMVLRTVDRPTPRHPIGIDKRFSRINGTCPLCEKPIELRGGPIKASNWRVCPECGKDIEIVAPATRPIERAATHLL